MSPCGGAHPAQPVLSIEFLPSLAPVARAASRLVAAGGMPYTSQCTHGSGAGAPDRPTPARPAGIAPGRRRGVPIPTSAPHSSPVLTALPEGRRSSIRRLRRLYKGELAPPSTPQEITVNSTERWHRARDAR